MTPLVDECDQNGNIAWIKQQWVKCMQVVDHTEYNCPHICGVFDNNICFATMVGLKIKQRVRVETVTLYAALTGPPTMGDLERSEECL